MECFNCGTKLGVVDTCPNCGINVKIYKKIMMASNAYYNDALEKADVRDLSGAIESLKISLRFNKMNMEARNLLGLIYFEMGEVVAALTEWVISKNYQPRENRAGYYLDEVQNNQARLDAINQTIKKYNQALLYCRQDSRDLAIIQLKKVLSLNPRLVRGHQLLALLYMQEGKYEAAKKALRNAAKIDANNTTTLRYLRETSEELKEGGSGKKQKNDEQISYRSGNETIIQPKYLNDNSAFATILNMLIGIAIGVAITWFLVVPGIRRELQNQAKTEVLEANNTISVRNQTISTLEAQIDELTSQITDVKNGEEEYASRINSYEQLLAAYQAYVAEDIGKAGDALANVNPDYLGEETKNIYNTINTQVNAEYVETMYRAGREAYDAQEYAEAVTNLQKVVEMDENYDSGYALYYLAQSYRRNEDTENAKIYYQKVVELYPGTERAATAQNFLDSTE